MARFSALAIAACVFALIANASAAAPSMLPRPAPVLLSGSTYHRSVCPGPALRGFRRCFAHVVTDHGGNVLGNRFVANRYERNAAAALVPSGFGPTSLISAYNPSVASHYPIGVGSSATVVAVVDAYGYVNAESDLAVYRSTYGLPACTSANGCFTKLNQLGAASGYPRADLGWSQETALDLDMVSAMCPHCKILLMEANTESNQDLAVAVKMAVTKGARVVSNSYGGPEGGPASDYSSYYYHPGVALTASTGDDGYAEGPEFPATSPFVTATGGTALKRATNTRGWTESAWVDGGSGCSQYYDKPDWQASITLCTKRMEADVSADADPDTGVAVYGPPTGTQSAWMVFGGTSVAAPLIGGIYGANGEAYYHFGNLYGKTVVLNDVTVGHNGSCGGTYFCTAGVGYDGPTGLGTPTGEHGF